MIDVPFLLAQAFAAHPLVHVNAALNALATVLLIAGMVLIKRGRRDAHARVMLATFLVSCAFLVCYAIYHLGVVGHVRFTHPGVVRYVYLTILLTHVVLAAAVPFLAVLTIYFGLVGHGWLKQESPADVKTRMLARHRTLAKWTFPIWLYVSITGVVVYVMLYHLWAAMPSGLT